jgi:hypothetical protein
MIRECYRHQHPEEFDRPAVDEPCLPAELRYGRSEDTHASTVTIPEEAMGHPEAWGAG